jgi:hypothetical protein
LTSPPLQLDVGFSKKLDTLNSQPHASQHQTLRTPLGFKVELLELVTACASVPILALSIDLPQSTFHLLVNFADGAQQRGSIVTSNFLDKLSLRLIPPWEKSGRERIR